MEAPRPGYFWKIPFIWEPGCKLPQSSGKLAFESAPSEWLLQAVASVMGASTDESDQAAVSELGTLGAAQELLTVDEECFELHASWWKRALNSHGQVVGLVLPVLLRPEKYWREGRGQGTIYYMGVLPNHRGMGYGTELLAEATRTLNLANCWRIFCDASARNEPMLAAFRSSGYLERSPWERPLR